ncbi:MMPL family transporter [Streptomyces sp. NPDC020412]|uniref:MMPL family transporter n=1 Tax=Streptomyces sp. NPDC020412 TaxID=3365073 RepID=UPI0037A40847
MATFLYRMGSWAFQRRRRVTLLWVAVLAAVGLAALNAAEASDDASGLPGIEAQKAFDLINERFPGAEAEGANARIVFVAPDGQKITAAEHRATVERLVTAVADGPQVADVVNPFGGAGVSEDASTAYATITYDVKDDDVTDAAKEFVSNAVEEAREAGLTVEAGGGAIAEEPPAGIGEVLGMGIAAVVLLVTFGSLAAAGVPLMTAVVGVGVSLASLIALSRAFGLTNNELSMMIGIAVGIDYALFVVDRYREERAQGHDPQEAAGLAVGTAGSAVVFAGLTVFIALAGLSVVGVPELTKMGLSAAGTVAVSVLVSLTLVPALLGFWPNAVLPRRDRRADGRAPRSGSRLRKGAGRQVEGANQARRVGLGRRARGADRPAGGDRSWGTRWGRFVLRRPVLVLFASVACLGALAVPALDLRLGTPGDEAKPTSSTERRAYDALADGFGPGFNGPLTVVVDATRADDPKAAVTTVSKEIAGTKGVAAVSPAQFNKAGDTAVLQATPSTAPTSKETKDLVHAIRDARPAFESATGATFEVTGVTALNIDVADKMMSALIPYLLIVVGLAFLLLTIVFHSLLVPLKAALGFLLSVLASFGVLVMVFQNGHGAGLLGIDQTGPILSEMPIFLVGIVFGLAMDYQVFLVSRMREAHVHGANPGEAVIAGFRHSGRLVVAAGLIMIAVFAGFLTAGDSLTKMVGFGLATAVLFDAFVVRLAFVPAVLVLLGRSAWWLPRPLARLLPRVGVEGEALSRRPPASPTAVNAADPDAVRI